MKAIIYIEKQVVAIIDVDETTNIATKLNVEYFADEEEMEKFIKDNNLIKPEK